MGLLSAVVWQASLQYLVLHLLHLFLWSWASGAAQAAQFVRIILRFAVSYRALRGGFSRLLEKPDYFNSQKNAARTLSLLSSSMFEHKVIYVARGRAGN